MHSRVLHTCIGLLTCKFTITCLSVVAVTTVTQVSPICLGIYGVLISHNRGVYGVSKWYHIDERSRKQWCQLVLTFLGYKLRKHYELLNLNCWIMNCWIMKALWIMNCWIVNYESIMNYELLNCELWKLYELLKALGLWPWSPLIILCIAVDNTSAPHQDKSIQDRPV